MAYSPTEWQTGDTITAEKLNKLENGVADGGSDVFEVNFTLEWDQQTETYTATSDKTYSEINAAFTANKRIYAWLTHDGYTTAQLVSCYRSFESDLYFYFEYRSDPGLYARYQIKVDSESVTPFVSFEAEPVYIAGDYSNESTLDEANLEVYNTALANGAPVYINIAAGNDGVGIFIISPVDYTGYCFAGPASAIGYTAQIDSETGEITVSHPIG